jgi:2-dehydropantoate 2-reductase
MTTQHQRLPICIAGAGNVGCFIGGMLADGGYTVVFLGRGRNLADIRAHGLHLSRFDGSSVRLAPDAIAATDDPSRLADAGIILVTTKGRDTSAMAALIARHARPDARVISLQNGVHNVGTLRSHLPNISVLGGMVPFNVTMRAPGHFHCATSGTIVVEADAIGTAAALTTPRQNILSSSNIQGVQWGKLLINLNNALNALSNLPLRTQLSQRAWRRLFATQIDEALAVLRVAGISPVPPTPLPASLLPYVLRLPDGLFHQVASRIINIDPTARSSMWDDIDNRRLTEIDDLQGVILGLATRHGLSAPLTQRIFDLIKATEARGLGSPGLSSDQIAASAL